MITPQLFNRILSFYPLRPEGIHGVGHWARVFENGMRLADTTGADRDVLALFAVFHDAQRLNDGRDDGHGIRGGELARLFWNSEYQLPASSFEQLYYACAHHTDGMTDGDITIQTCWDADRLDLARVGIRPAKKYLCTKPARTPELIQWGTARAREKAEPEEILLAWGWGRGLSGAGST